jgi:hypothetical protein
MKDLSEFSKTPFGVLNMCCVKILSRGFLGFIPKSVLQRAQPSYCEASFQWRMLNSSQALTTWIGKEKSGKY